MFGPHELEILFLEVQAEVEASSVDLSQVFIDKYASLRERSRCLWLNAASLIFLEQNLAMMVGCEFLSKAGDSLWETLISSAFKSTPPFLKHEELDRQCSHSCTLCREVSHSGLLAKIPFLLLAFEIIFFSVITHDSWIWPEVRIRTKTNLQTDSFAVFESSRFVTTER